METTEKLELGIGTKETESLKEAIVKIVDVRIEKLGTKGNEKAIFSSKHPQKELPIDISSVQYLKGKNVNESGSWLNLDEDGKIKKDSALASLMKISDAVTIKDMKYKEVQTVVGDNGYLCFKAY